MSKKKDPFRKRDVRIQQNAVTGNLESTVLDDVQKEFELITGFAEGRLLKMDCAADRHRLAAKLQEWFRRAQPHTDGPQE